MVLRVALRVAWLTTITNIKVVLTLHSHGIPLTTLHLNPALACIPTTPLRHTHLLHDSCLPLNQLNGVFEGSTAHFILRILREVILGRWVLLLRYVYQRLLAHSLAVGATQVLSSLD